MPLHKIRDFDPDYRNYFGDHDILGYDLYSGEEKVGSVEDLLVDDEGKFRYFVINTGVWVFGKKVLLPIGRSRISYSDRRIYANGLTRTQVEELPEYNNLTPIDYDQEERVRGVYRRGETPLDTKTPVDTTATPATPATPATDRNTYHYDRDAALYNMNEQDHQDFRLYEERVVANKTRRKTGEVKVGKHVETETAHVSVPVEKERIVIDRTNPTDAGTVVTPGADAFKEGEAIRMEVYEETPDIRKETVVREDVRVRKEVDRDTVEVDETVRKERLDIDKQGRAIDEPSETPRNRA
ncbi:MAG: DUF2382 domain-containing protein [Cyanobacteria bacterium CRU_2_1]|nr:DUF2382 domain-containing protein [Cyanobacteria bacterium RU_5_0]NJR58176.1 DUF2382 domain-containing protein [Cyanobacteria bacterium CRU_2_1]